LSVVAVAREATGLNVFANLALTAALSPREREMSEGDYDKPPVGNPAARRIARFTAVLASCTL
jgi:hypothetical protein